MKVLELSLRPKKPQILEENKQLVQAMLVYVCQNLGLDLISVNIVEQLVSVWLRMPTNQDERLLCESLELASGAIIAFRLNEAENFWQKGQQINKYLPATSNAKGDVYKILVTGGAGFIGSNLVDGLVEAGHEVVVIDNLASGKQDYVNAAAKFYEVDICHKEKIEQIFAAEKFDYVFHLAAQIDVRKSVDDPVFDNYSNAVGSYNIFKAAVDTQVKRVVFISTGGALYGDVTEPATEQTPVLPLSPYAIHKYTAERYLALLNDAQGLDYTVLRLANVYGPRQYKGGEAGVVAIFVDHALRGQEFTVNGDGTQIRDYVYVGDVVNACLAAMKNKQSGTYNIGAGTEHSVLDLVQSLQQAIGELSYKHAPAKAGEVYRSVLNWTKARNELGWQPQVSLEEGIKRTIAWSRQQQQK